MGRQESQRVSLRADQVSSLLHPPEFVGGRVSDQGPPPSLLVNQRPPPCSESSYRGDGSAERVQRTLYHLLLPILHRYQERTGPYQFQRVDPKDGADRPGLGCHGNLALMDLEPEARRDAHLVDGTENSALCAVVHRVNEARPESLLRFIDDTHSIEEAGGPPYGGWGHSASCSLLR